MSSDEHFQRSADSGRDINSEFDRLRDLLVAPEAMALQDLRTGLAELKSKIHDPEHIIELVLPVITDILARRISQSSEIVAKTVAPIIDKAIRERTMQDRGSIAAAIGPIIMEAINREVSISREDFAAALAPVSSLAIAKQHTHAPDQVAEDLAPIMGAAIKKQILSERDTMVDALYPVIGSTIAKYMAEALNNLVQSINEKLERSLSVAGLARKARARLQGVTEAELILKDSVSCTIEAVFLIHKSSGLVIAEARREQSLFVDPDLLSGMLTAIRSFFNESFGRVGSISELDQIEYGQSKIVLEVAGYCYMAAVIEGEPRKEIKATLRGALAQIVQEHGNTIESYRGDRRSVPQSIETILHAMVLNGSSVANRPKEAKKPYAAVALFALVIILLLCPPAIYIYRNAIDRDVESKTAQAFASSPLFLSQSLSLSADRGVLTVTGVVPNEYMQHKADELARSIDPSNEVKNNTIVGNAPPLPILVTAEISTIESRLNTLEGIEVFTTYQNGQLTVGGTVRDSDLAQGVFRAFEMLPGIRAMKNEIMVRKKEIAIRILFDAGSVLLKTNELSKVLNVKALLEKEPDLNVIIVGHADQLGDAATNSRLALGRAMTVQRVLVARGVKESRLQAQGRREPPPGLKDSYSNRQSRCVRFEIVRQPNSVQQ